jgi:hypothetical protein
VVIGLYVFVFANQEAILGFVAKRDVVFSAGADGEPDWRGKALVSLCVFLLVPFVAYTYGTVAKTFMKLIKME